MGAICGIIGKRDIAALEAMVCALRRRAPVMHKSIGDAYAVAASHPLPSMPAMLDGEPRVRRGPTLDAVDVHAHAVQTRAPERCALNGPYAAVLALDDPPRWWLMRDVLGRKPLYYFQGNGLLAFASELKALLASGLPPRRLNLIGVDRYLTLRCVPGPESIIHSIYRVQPGHVVEYRDGNLTSVRCAGFSLDAVDQSRDFAARQLRSLLNDSLEHNSAESILWASGLDCAALAALNPGLKPVFVALERGWQDEARLAKESARRMHLPLMSVASRRLTEDAFHRAVFALDEPLADASVFPLWLIAEAASERKTTFVSGHGADELLGGYPRYHFLQKARGANRFVPAGLLSDLMPALPPNAFIRRAGRYLVSMRDAQESYLSLVSVFDHGEREELYTDAMKSALHELGSSMPAMQYPFNESDLASNVLALDLHVGLPDLLLAKCDRMASAHGMTIRYPYLDDELVAYAAGLPPEVKFGVRSKPLLRIAMKGILPGPIRLRARRGFHVPLSGRLMKVIENVAAQSITPERVDATGIFRWHTVDAIVRAAGHNIYRRRQFWALLMFFAWYRNLMEA